MAKKVEHSTNSVTKNGKTQTKVVSTVVRDGKLVADRQSPESEGVRI